MNLQDGFFQSRLFAKQPGGVAQGTRIVFLSAAHSQRSGRSLSGAQRMCPPPAERTGIIWERGSSGVDPGSQALSPTPPVTEELISAPRHPHPPVGLAGSDASAPLYNVAGGAGSGQAATSPLQPVRLPADAWLGSAPGSGGQTEPCRPPTCRNGNGRASPSWRATRGSSSRREALGPPGALQAASRVL